MSIDQRLNSIDRLKKAVPVAVILGLGASACSTAEAGGTREGELNPHIVSVELDSGANVRETPIRPDVESDNLLVQTEAAITLDTPTGVHTFEDNNGTWYGVSAKDLAGHLEDDELKEAILKDEDGKVWINDDRATAGYKHQ